jgi:DNA-binding SARP family transcriptional activator
MIWQYTRFVLTTSKCYTDIEVTMLKVCLLGSFDVTYEGRVIQISSRPAQSLFVYLVLNSEKKHRREKLARMLWPDSIDVTARENLRHALWRIRKAFPSDLSDGYFISDDFTVAFFPSTHYWLDVATLKKSELCTRADELITSLSVYQGELLPGFDDEWVTLERGYLNFVFEHNMARLMKMLEVEKRWLEVLDWGERWIAFGQRPEPAYRALMLAHTKKGDVSKMGDAYERCVRSLGEIGLEPSEQTRELYASLKAENLREAK